MQVYRVLSKMISPVVTIACCLIASTALAGMYTIVREATGYGGTQKEAVVNGLIEAVQQVKGVKISSQESLKTAFKEVVESSNDQQSESSVTESHYQQNIFTRTGGYVDAYQVLDVRPSDDGDGWQARLRVTFPMYKAPGAMSSNRLRIAVLPFRFSQDVYAFGDQNVAGAELSSLLEQSLVAGFAGARRFAVLDRTYVHEILQEKKLILSKDVPVREQAKLGQVLGTDLLLVGMIDSAEHRQDVYTIELTGESGVNQYALLSLSCRIISVATREIKWAETLLIEFHDDQCRQVPPRSMPQALSNTAAHVITAGALSAIYPMQIVAVQAGGAVVLNQGGGTIAVGDQLTVYRKGKKMIDPYTKESLGHAESPIAQATVTRVTQKMTYAQIDAGRADAVRKGDICRPAAIESPAAASVSAMPAGRQSSVKNLSNGGVVLPFD